MWSSIKQDWLIIWEICSFLTCETPKRFQNVHPIEHRIPLGASWFKNERGLFTIQSLQSLWPVHIISYKTEKWSQKVLQSCSWERKQKMILKQSSSPSSVQSAQNTFYDTKVCNVICVYSTRNLPRLRTSRLKKVDHLPRDHEWMRRQILFYQQRSQESMTRLSLESNLMVEGLDNLELRRWWSRGFWTRTGIQLCVRFG